MTIGMHTHLMPGVARAGEGPTHNVFGHSVIFKHSTQDTAGNCFVWEITSPPGTMVPPHVHTIEDEFIYVQDGEFAVMVGGENFHAGPGDLIRMPKGVPHGIQQVGDKTTRTLWIVAPAGRMEDLFVELGKLPAGPPDPAMVGRIFAEHGITLLPPPGL